MLTKLKSAAKVLLFVRLTNKRELKCSFSFLFLYKKRRNKVKFLPLIVIDIFFVVLTLQFSFH